MLKVFNACQVVPAEGDGKSLDKSAHSAIDASGQNAKQAQLDPGIARSGSYRASSFDAYKKLEPQKCPAAKDCKK